MLLFATVRLRDFSALLLCRRAENTRLLLPDSYTDGPSAVYSPSAVKDLRNRLPSVPLFGVGTQVIAIDHEVSFFVASF